ncbi:hypothetical protein [Microbacterium suaedae]|uniref:hypothetical protein n=1 Tax=Microbacterium suaedae TaxID=2067813 RepID=UPI000DA13E9E|nr:hypothetical protein [Microbacterium suaedae]
MTASVVYRRVLRRETHRARTVPAVIVAVLTAALVFAGAWWMADPALRAAAEQLTASADVAAIGSTAGVVALVVAAVLIAFGVLPGRRARRGRVAGRIAVLVDDGVLAGAAADEVARRCAVVREHVSVTVGHRLAIVRVTPTSGVPVDEGSVREAAHASFAALGFDTKMRVRVTERGVVS